MIKAQKIVLEIFLSTAQNSIIGSLVFNKDKKVCLEKCYFSDNIRLILPMIVIHHSDISLVRKIVKSSLLEDYEGKVQKKVDIKKKDEPVKDKPVEVKDVQKIDKSDSVKETKEKKDISEIEKKVSEITIKKSEDSSSKEGIKKEKTNEGWGEESNVSNNKSPTKKSVHLSEKSVSSESSKKQNNSKTKSTLATEDKPKNVYIPPYLKKPDASTPKEEIKKEDGAKNDGNSVVNQQKDSKDALKDVKVIRDEPKVEKKDDKLSFKEKTPQVIKDIEPNKELKETDPKDDKTVIENKKEDHIKHDVIDTNKSNDEKQLLNSNDESINNNKKTEDPGSEKEDDSGWISVKKRTKEKKVITESSSSTTSNDSIILGRKPKPSNVIPYVLNPTDINKGKEKESFKQSNKPNNPKSRKHTQQNKNGYSPEKQRYGTTIYKSNAESYPNNKYKKEHTGYNSNKGYSGTAQHTYRPNNTQSNINQKDRSPQKSPGASDKIEKPRFNLQKSTPLKFESCVIGISKIAENFTGSWRKNNKYKKEDGKDSEKFAKTNKWNKRDRKKDME